jgi:hypothetical protein
MQVGVYAWTSTNVYAYTRAGYLSASESDWWKSMYMHAQVRMFEGYREWLMQVDVYAYTSTDVYACTSADVWVLARVIDASQCIPMHKYNVYAYTSMAEFIITVPSYACVYVWYTQIHAHTARWLGWWCFLYMQSYTDVSVSSCYRSCMYNYILKTYRLACSL